MISRSSLRQATHASVFLACVAGLTYGQLLNRQFPVCSVHLERVHVLEQAFCSTHKVHLICHHCVEQNRASNVVLPCEDNLRAYQNLPLGRTETDSIISTSFVSARSEQQREDTALISISPEPDNLVQSSLDCNDYERTERHSCIR
jgi:hypothetical protein